MQLVSDFENIEAYGYGRNGTTFFLLAYYHFLEEINAKHVNTTDMWYVMAILWLFCSTRSLSFVNEIIINR